ncbi:hypothetical protein [Yoonia sp.]|uniref:hypothetical protein n=1 Tax=Yoonia sp. TaxID=2212373 RepID=UPI003F6C8E76
MTRNILCITSAIALFAAAPALAAGPITVTSNADSGDGSLRAALIAAETATAPVQIVMLTQDDLQLQSGLVYAGTAPVTIFGAGQTIATGLDITLLTSANGADLNIHDLTFRGPGGFDINTRADADGTAGKGVFIDVRDDQTGTVTLSLTNVTVADVANHGVHVSDCSLADSCGGGGGGAGEGSAASIIVTLNNVTVDNVGNGKFDADGLRVDERGPGDIRVTGQNVTFTRVGADGAELDEGQDGNVVVELSGARFVNNGGYCHPDILSAFMPSEDEGEFDEGQMAADAIPGPITGSPDDACFEREVDLYDDGSVEAYEFAIDVDDGFDVDEAGIGSIHGTLTGTEISDNLDEGLDFDEEDAGDIVISINGFDGSGNADDAIKMSEAGEGHVLGLIANAVLTANGGVGIVLEEEDAGDVYGTVTGVTTAGNDDGDLGLEAVQEDEGAGTMTVVASFITDGVEVEGVTLAD